MGINLLPKEYQNDLQYERIKRLVISMGAAIFLIIFVNILFLLSLLFLFGVQEKELVRQLESSQKSPVFLRITDIESNIAALNAEISIFNNQEKNMFKVSPAIKSILNRRLGGVRISSISFFSADQSRNQPPRISIIGTAKNRELLLSFTKSNEANDFFKKVNSPISNLLKEMNFDYSLILDLAP